MALLLAVLLAIPWQETVADTHLFHLRNGGAISGRLLEENDQTYLVLVDRSVKLPLKKSDVTGVSLLPKPPPEVKKDVEERKADAKAEGQAVPALEVVKRPPKPAIDAIVEKGLLEAIPKLGREKLEVAARDTLVREITGTGDAGLAYLAWMLTSPRWEDRRDGARAIGGFRNVGSIGSLLPLLKDKDWTVQEQAANALGLIGDRAAIEPLLDLLGPAPKPEVRAAAGRALRRITNEFALGDAYGPWADWWKAHRFDK